MWKSPYGNVFARSFSSPESLPFLTAVIAVWNNPDYWNDVEAWNE